MKRLFNAVATAQNRQQDGRPLVRLIIAVMNPVRFSSHAQFDQCRAQVNEKLLFSGLKVREDGKVVREARPAATVAEARQRADDLRAELKRRDAHADVLHFCRAELLQQNYFHAVLEASKSVADKLRTKTGKDGDGSALVDATCSLNSGPRIAFNNFATEWERSEQTGIAMLMKGLFSTFRNPAAHAPKVLRSVRDFARPHAAAGSAGKDHRGLTPAAAGRRRRPGCSGMRVISKVTRGERHADNIRPAVQQQSACSQVPAAKIIYRRPPYPACRESND